MDMKIQGEDAVVYEVSYLLLPTISEGEIKKATIKDVLTSFGGTVISGEEPVLIDLAYPMTKVVGTIRHKCDSGYFGWVKFEMGKENILSAKKALDENDEILRYLIIKTVRENTLLNGKMMLKKEIKIPSEATTDEVLDNVEVVAPLNIQDEVTTEVITADLDKSIDDLVIV